MKTQEAIDSQLKHGESCELVLVASRTVDTTAAAGRLCLTNQRLLFVPRGFNIKGHTPWSVDRAMISGIDVAGRTWQPYNGGMRRRLLIRCADGSQQFFVINRVDAAVKDLRERLSLGV